MVKPRREFQRSGQVGRQRRRWMAEAAIFVSGEGFVRECENREETAGSWLSKSKRFAECP